MTVLKKKPNLAALRNDTRGSVLVEAALIMPLVVLFIAGIADYGVTLYQYHTLSTANGAAVRQLIVSRGFTNPYTGVLSEYSTWAPNLTVTGSQITVKVANSGGTLTTCTDSTNPTCKTLLDGAAGKQATVSINYPCTTTFIPSMASPCPIKITASGMVE
jgi:Flp pilus assembly protein TadG